MNPPFPKCVRVGSKPHLYCPGCGHPDVLKAFGFAVDDLGIQQKVAFGIDIGCSLLAWNYFDLDTIETHHGRTIPTMAGVKRSAPESIAVAYVGDGGAYAIGAGHLLNAAIRDEKIMVIVVNNAQYGMTGGQESPTTLPGTKVATAPEGADQYYIRAPEIIRSVNPGAFVARGIATVQPALRMLMKAGLQHVMDGKGFAFLEVLSPCPQNWGTMGDAKKTFNFLEGALVESYPLKKY